MAPIAATILLILSVVAAAAAAWAIERAWSTGWGSVLSVVAGLITLGTGAFVGLTYLDHLWMWSGHPEQQALLAGTGIAWLEDHRSVSTSDTEPGFSRYSDRARKVLVLAQEEARLLSHSFIGTEHLLLGLIQEGDGIGAKALTSFGISLEAVREKVNETIGPAGHAPAGSPPFTPRAKRVLDLSLREALLLGHKYIGTEHVLLGLIREGEGVAAQVLLSLGVDLSSTRVEVVRLLTDGRTGSA